MPAKRSKEIGYPNWLRATSVNTGATTDYIIPTFVAVNVSAPVGVNPGTNVYLGSLYVEIVYQLRYRSV